MIILEHLREKEWVRFMRYTFPEGAVDCWVGDQSCNPNNTERSNYNLNSNHRYYRLVGSSSYLPSDGWMPESFFTKDLHLTIHRQLSTNEYNSAVTLLLNHLQ